MSDTPDHYEVLGVPRDASTADIERARKRLALIWHPDRNPSANAAQHFDEVQKAAEVLRNPAARAVFDRDFALRAAMSIPRDLRDRHHAEPPPGPAHPASAFIAPASPQPSSTAPGSTAPGSTAPASTEPGHVRPGGRRRLRAASRKARLLAGLVALIVVAGGATVFLVGQGHRVTPATPAPRSAAGPARGGTAGSRGTFPLPQYTPGQAILPVNGGRVLSIGPHITLLAAGGHLVWRKTASLTSLDTNPASSGGPHDIRGCVVDGNTSGRRYDFISLASGQQAVVTEKHAPATGSMALAGDRVALPDGTIRDPCTGAVLGRAAPGGAFTTAECLTGQVVIGSARSSQMAWKNGHELWQQRTHDPLVCDGHGSVLMLHPTVHRISLIDPLNGRARWTVHDPGCPHDCLGFSGSAVQVLGSGGTVLFSDADQVLALARGSGRLLWRKQSQCALAARAWPSPEVLLGSCPGHGHATSGGAIVAAATGAVVSTDTVGGNGCGPGGRWAASSRQLLVVCPGPSAGQRRYLAQLTNW